MKFETRRIRALVLLLVTIIGLVMSFGENVLCAGEPPGAHNTAGASPGQDLSQLHESDCPCAPAPSHPSNDHFCIGDCGCPCQAPLTSSALTFTCSRSFTYLFPSEISQHIPEVYLSLFVPPDSTVA